MEKNKIVVIGSAGFVGSSIVKKCKENGYKVDEITSKSLNLLNEGSAEKLSKVIKKNDIVIAVSAIAPVKTIADFSDNLKIIHHISEALKIVNPCYLLNIGSDAVFIDQKEPLIETSIRSPESLHGAMHLSREICFSSLGIPFATLRPTLIYGFNDPHNGYGPNKFFRLAEKNQQIPLFGNGEELRDHIHISDVSEAAFRMIENKYLGSLNIASGEVISFREIAEVVINYLGSSSKIISLDRSGPMPHDGYRAFDISSLKSSFPGFIPKCFREGIINY